jgi:general L-amino acid transport system ATP-binding protein
MIEFTGVSKYYSDSKILNNININIKKGEKLIICGPSGGGKSTFLKCINGLENYDSGSIKVDGLLLDNTESSKKIIREKVSYVFQTFNLFPHLDILTNLTLPLIKVKNIPEHIAKKIAMENLKKVYIEDQIHKYPNQLSGGQQQRAAIARALSMQSEIILIDEPTSSLDPEMINEVLDVILELSRDNITIVCVTHEMGFAKKLGDNIILLDEGNIVEYNNIDGFFNNPKEERTKLFLSKVLR